MVKWSKKMDLQKEICYNVGKEEVPMSVQATTTSLVVPQ